MSSTVSVEVPDFNTLDDLFAQLEAGRWTLAVVYHGRDLMVRRLPPGSEPATVYFHGLIPVGSRYSLRCDDREILNVDLYDHVDEPQRSQALAYARRWFGLRRRPVPWDELECIVNVRRVP